LFAPKENTCAPFNAMVAGSLPVRKFAMSPRVASAVDLHRETAVQIDN
jgi:hypothetical protein